MFSESFQRLDGIEDIFKGIVAFSAGTVLPLYTQYENLQLLKQQSEFQRQTQSTMPTTAPSWLGTGFAEPSLGGISITTLFIGGLVLIGGYLVISSMSGGNSKKV